MKEALHKYLSHFERLQDDKIDDLLSTVSENFIFEDPFQKIKGKSEIIATDNNNLLVETELLEDLEHDSQGDQSSISEDNGGNPLGIIVEPSSPDSVGGTGVSSSGPTEFGEVLPRSTGVTF